MATTNLKSNSIGDIKDQIGNGIPDHVAKIGSYYTDLDTGEKYTNVDGNTRWDLILTHGKTKMIKSQSELGTPIGSPGKYMLDDDTTYLINGTVILSYPLELGEGTSIRGSSSNTDILYYIGTDYALYGYEKSSTVRNVTIIAPNAQCVDFTDFTKTKSIFFIDTIFYISKEIGRIRGYDNIVFNFTFHKNCLDGIKVGCYNNFIITNTFFNTPSGTAIQIGSCTGESITVGRSLIQNNLFKIAGGSPGAIGINIESENITFEGVTSISVNGFDGEGEFFSGFTIQDKDIRRYANTGTFTNYTILSPVTNNVMNNIVDPSDGTMFYNTDTDKVVIYSNSEWREIALTTIYTELFNDDFESGDFATGGWTVVNGTEDNYWIVGIDGAFEGTYSAYITDDGTTNEYSVNKASVSHIYKDIAIPADAENIRLQITQKCNGETTYDYGSVYAAPNTVTPVAGTEVSVAYLIEDFQNGDSSWRANAHSIPNTFAGTTLRLIFSWRCDNTVGNQPPFAIDNVIVEYN